MTVVTSQIENILKIVPFVCFQNNCFKWQLSNFAIYLNNVDDMRFVEWPKINLGTEQINLMSDLIGFADDLIWFSFDMIWKQSDRAFDWFYLIFFKLELDWHALILIWFGCSGEYNKIFKLSNRSPDQVIWKPDAFTSDQKKIISDFKEIDSGSDQISKFHIQIDLFLTCSEY